MALTICAAAGYGSAYPWRVGRIYEIYIECRVEADSVARSYIDRFIHYAAHAEFIKIAHGKNLHTYLARQFSLSFIYVAYTNYDTVLRLHFGRETADRGQLFHTVTEQNCERHAMYISCRCSLWSIHIKMSIYPDNTDVLILRKV